ncbi:Cof-type HAD-IIB family hydrolase [Mycoplasma sp. 527]
MYAIINNKKPVIFSDVDGTLYRNFDLRPDTEYDIRFAIDNGADFNICTGNPVQERMLNLAKRLNVRYLLCSSGAEIYDVKKAEIIKSWNIEFSYLEEVIKIANELNLQVIFWDDKNYFYLKDEKIIIDEVINYHFVSDKNKKMIPKLWKGEFIKPIKIELYAIDDQPSTTLYEKIYDSIKHLKDKMEIIVTHCNIEINSLGVNKGSAVRWMVENIYSNEEVMLKEAMTIGDSNNDTPMLKLTDYSYAMDNSSNEVLKTAKLFTSDVAQNGLGEAILDYLYRLKNITRKYMFHEFIKEK